MSISAYDLAIYRATAQRSHQARERALAGRKERAWEVARHAAKLLRQEFHASRVMTFGSLVRKRGFSEHSDIDLAAWGLDKMDYFMAVARLQEIDFDFEIDLVDVNNCKPELLRVIIEEGIEL